jgi:large subunit ribosomal protein L15
MPNTANTEAAADTAATSATRAKKKSDAETGAQADTNRAALLKVHHLRPAPGSRTPKTRVGRGEGSKGKTAGRGTKGTKARYQVSARFEGGQMPLHMRLPKLKGFTNRFRTEYQVVNLDRLGALYPQGGQVTVEDLAAKGAVRAGELVKVLGDGELSVALQVSAHRFSASAKEKIEAAGGSVTTL